MIPKVFFVYWGANKLSWLRYLTVYSFHKFHPDWDIRVYTTEHPVFENQWTTGELGVNYEGKKDWFLELANIPRVTMHTLNMEDYGLSNDAPEVQKADALKLWALYEHGGLFSDFDVLFYAPVDVKSYKSILCLEPGDQYYSIGVIGSVPGNPMYKNLMDAAPGVALDKYQGMGPTLWNAVLPREEWWGEDVWNLPMEALYPYDSNNVKQLYAKGKFKKSGFAVHWYGGHPLSGEWAAKLTPENYTQFDNRLCNLIKEII